MKTTHSDILALQLFAHPQGSKTICAQHALGRVRWALLIAETALCDLGSPEHRALVFHGFASVTLVNPAGRDVVCFDQGHSTQLSADGLSVVREGARGYENLIELIAWLHKARSYMEWACETMTMRANQERPPVFDSIAYGDVDPAIRLWAGTVAEGYQAAWKEQRTALYVETVKRSQLEPLRS